MGRAALFAWAVALLACSTNGGDDDGVSPEKACSDYASAVCERVSTCAPVQLAAEFGTTSECLGAQSSFCRSFFFPRDARTSGMSMEKCSVAVAGEDCFAWFDGNALAECAVVPGTRENGQPCGSPYQCASGACAAGFGECGTCGDASASSCPSVFGVCPGGDCNGETCVPRARPGEACGLLPGAPRCGGDAECIDGVCVADQRHVGDPCTPEILDCSPQLGLTCDPSTSTCALAPMLHLGDACTPSRDVCSDEGYCDATTARCTARPRLGDACGGDAACVEPLACIAGRCSAFDPSSCG